VISD